MANAPLSDDELVHIAVSYGDRVTLSRRDAGRRAERVEKARHLLRAHDLAQPAWRTTLLERLRAAVAASVGEGQ